jgi:hypothetical protein
MLLTVVGELLLLGYQDQSHPTTPHHNSAAKEVTDAAGKSIAQTLGGSSDGCFSVLVRPASISFFF